MRKHRSRQESQKVLERGDFKAAQSETIGGFIFEELGRIPRKGESFQFGSFQITVLEATERAVTRVKFEKGTSPRKRMTRREE